MSIKTDNTLPDLLHSCGFSSKEQRVVIAMLSSSWRPAALIARDAKLKRPTVYALLEQLIELGVVIRKKRDNVALYSLVSREMLPKIIERKVQNQYEENRRAVHSLATCLASLTPAREMEIGGYEVATFESLEVTMLYFEQLLTQGGYVGIFDPEFLKNPPAKQAVLRFLRKTQKTRPTIRELVVGGTMATWYLAQIQNPNHQVRVIQPKSPIPTDMVIVGGEVLLFHYSQEGQGSIRIKHDSYFRSMRSLFDLLWGDADN